MNIETGNQENLQSSNPFLGKGQENLSGMAGENFERQGSLPNFQDAKEGDDFSSHLESDMDETRDFSDLKHDLPQFEEKENSEENKMNDSSEKNSDNLKKNEGEEKISYEIHTRNESLEDDRHPITGVPFERKTVEDSDGNEVTGVFPKFESKFDAQLTEDKLQATDNEQFSECNTQLKDAVDNNPEMAKQFSSEQLEQIKNGDTPDGCTWHHNEEKGKMQLVDSQVHEQTGHTGGRSIWGGGTESR